MRGRQNDLTWCQQAGRQVAWTVAYWSSLPSYTLGLKRISSATIGFGRGWARYSWGKPFFFFLFLGNVEGWEVYSFFSPLTGYPLRRKKNFRLSWINIYLWAKQKFIISYLGLNLINNIFHDANSQDFSYPQFMLLKFSCNNLRENIVNF